MKKTRLVDSRDAPHRIKTVNFVQLNRRKIGQNNSCATFYGFGTPPGNPEQTYTISTSLIHVISANSVCLFIMRSCFYHPPAKLREG